MQNETELTVEVRVDTEEARREVDEFRRYALGVIEELRAAFASLGQLQAGVGAADAGPGRRV